MTFVALTRPTRRSSLRLLDGMIVGALLLATSVACAQRILPDELKATEEAASARTNALVATSIVPSLPEAPSALLRTSTLPPAEENASSSSSFPLGLEVDWVDGVQNPTDKPPQKRNKSGESDVDANGKPIPVDRHQTQRIGGIIPNYRAVSGGAVAHPPGFKYNFKVATRQAFDYAGFIFLGITSLSAEGLNEHPVFGKGIDGFWKYTWHGFIDKTDGTYLQAWLLPSLLHEDTRYYALGNQHKVVTRFLYVVSRQAVARTYGGHNTPNIAGLGGKVLTQYISRFYYPANTTPFATLATKFGYGVARDIGFTALREFYPDYLGYEARKKQRKAVARSALDRAAVHASEQSQGTPPATNPKL